MTSTVEAIISHTSNEITCTSKRQTSTPTNSKIQILYFVRADDETANYIMKTNFNFEFRDLELSNQNHFYEDNTLKVSADIPFVVPPTSIKGLALEDGTGKG